MAVFSPLLGKGKAGDILNVHWGCYVTLIYKAGSPQNHHWTYMLPRWNYFAWKRYGTVPKKQTRKPNDRWKSQANADYLKCWVQCLLSPQCCNLVVLPSLCSGHGHQWFALLWLYGCTPNGNSHNCHGAAVHSGSSGWWRTSHSTWAQGRLNRMLHSAGWVASV